MTQTETPPTATVEGAPAVLTGETPAGTSGGTQPIDLSFTVSIPQIGAYRTADHRYYWNGKGPLPSVTSILGILDKPAIVQWAKRIVAEIAYDRWEEIGGLMSGPRKEVAEKLFAIVKDGVDIPASPNKILRTGEVNSPERRDAVTRWLAGMPDYQADTAAKLGSGVHLLADMVSREAQVATGAFEISEQEKPYLDAFLAFLEWLRTKRGAIVSSEKMVWSEQGYAGTYDLLVRLEDELWLLDIKTSKGYYPEYALQLIAYGYADWIIVEDNPEGYPMPMPNRYGILHLRPEVYPDTGWRLIEYPLIEKDYVAFLGVLEVYRWKKEGRYRRSSLKKAQKEPKEKASKG